MSLELITIDIDINDNNDVNININNDNDDININPLDYGIDTTNQSINYVNNQIINNNQLINPFIINLEGGNLKNYPINSIWHYPHVNILTKKSNQLTEKNYNHFFKIVFDLNDLENIIMDDFIKIEKVNTNILNNKYFYNRANIITQDILKYFFKQESFNTSEIFISMIDIPVDLVKSIFAPYNSLDKILTIVRTYNKYNKYVDTNFKNYINNIPTINYWTNNKHCNINITELFTLRDFQSKKKSSFTLICKPNNPDNIADETGDSTSYPQRIKNKDNFCDIGVSIRKDKKGFFPSINDKDYKSIVTNIFKSLDYSNKFKYILSNNLLVSKDYTHTVINNVNVLKMLKPLFEKYPGAYKYSFGYAWLNLYLEETLYTTKSNKNHRHVFDIATASNLPIFPFSMDNLKQNPYIPLLLDDKQINYNNSCLPINSIKNYTGYGISDLETFKQRLNLFITKDVNKDIFNGINWSKFALSGSIIPACLQKLSPLLDVFNKLYEDKNIAFTEFINKYYATSDIDIMCNSKSFYDFLDEGYNVFNIIKNNINANETNSKIETICSFGISVTKEFFIDTLKDFNAKYNLAWSLQDYLNNINDERVKEYLYKIYVEYKIKKIEEFKQNNFITHVLREEITKIIPYDKISLYYVEYDLNSIKYLRETEFVLNRNDFSDITYDTKNNIRVIKFSENFRFKFHFDSINRQIEYFKIGSEDFFNLVGKFHLPCVRAYYQGNNVYMLPSCITALMTGINIEYKYFAGIRNPVEIINKYMQRGYGVVLNAEELRQFNDYNAKLPDDNIFKLKDNQDNSLVGIRNINHKSFNFNNIDNIKYEYMNSQDLQDYYDKYNNLIDALKFTHINKNGDINKCILSYFELYYSSVN